MDSNIYKNYSRFLWNLLMVFGKELDTSWNNAQPNHMINGRVAFGTEDLSARQSGPQLDSFIGIHHSFNRIYC